MRKEMIYKDAAEGFSSDIELTKNGLISERKLNALRNELLDIDPMIVTGDFYTKKKIIEKSRIYEALMEMPKGVVHHLHLTAACDVFQLVKLTYKDYVYYSEHKNVFKVSKTPITEEGFIKTNTLRKHWGNANSFDEMLSKRILLGHDEIKC